MIMERKNPPALVKGELLVWARRCVRMGPKAAAQHLRISRERLVAWEKNRAKPTLNQLRKLAQLYRRPLAVFYLPRPPKFKVPFVS